MPEFRVVGVSRHDLSAEEIRALAREGIEQFGRLPFDDAEWDRFAARLSHVNLTDGPEALATAVNACDQELRAAHPAGCTI